MERSFKIACRNSWLSLAQVETFKQRVSAIYPKVKFEIVCVGTIGDLDQHTPLHLIGGKDIFTKEVQETVHYGAADFAVHSLKDVNSEHFFNNSRYAVIDREDIRDVVIFNPDIEQKISKGIPLRIGVSAPSRGDSAIAFLKKVLPNPNQQSLTIQSEPIRGNVETRLKKLHQQEFDGVILAVAGLNRLLRYEPSAATIAQYLLHKRTMVLPLFECPPVSGQGVVVVEAFKSNQDAVKLLQCITDKEVLKQVKTERKLALQYGYDYLPPFGLFHLKRKNFEFIYASGKNKFELDFSEWFFEPQLDIQDKVLFSATDHMKDFFKAEPIEEVVIDDQFPVVFVASHKAVNTDDIRRNISSKKVWAAGTRSWYELAKMGIWVDGCADGLGLSFLMDSLAKPFYNISQSDILILTNNISKFHWQDAGWNVLGTYNLVSSLSENLIAKIAAADIVFWTSYQQYSSCKKYVKWNAIHCCPSGKTACMMEAEGVRPVIFPTIRSFIDWRSKINF